MLDTTKTNTTNVNKASDLIQTTGHKYEPNIVLFGTAYILYDQKDISYLRTHDTFFKYSS